jgi:putative selenium metabolism hydrolase
MSSHSRYAALARANLPALLAFTQRLIQTPSLSGQEGAIAQVVAGEMRALGYDEVWIDAVGNVIGVLRGRRPGSAIQFNSHLDHVSPGDAAAWKYPPYAGVIADGAVWGAGASDTKGALACQVYAIAALRQAEPDFAGDIYVVGVVQEEVGAVGSRELVATLPADCVILGEATDNQLSRGHRGGFKIFVHAHGVAAHASVPHLAVNPHYMLANFLSRLRDMPMAVDAVLGPSSAAPTLYGTDQTSSNVIPGQAWVLLDWRSTPGETPEAAMARLRPLADAATEPGGSITLEARGRLELTTYTGLKRIWPGALNAFVLPLEHPAVVAAHAALEEGMGRPTEIFTWRFCTDGPWFVEAGIPVLGYAPAREGVPHTAQDHVRIDKLEEGYCGNIALALRLGATRLR